MKWLQRCDCFNGSRFILVTKFVSILLSLVVTLFALASAPAQAVNNVPAKWGYGDSNLPSPTDLGLGFLGCLDAASSGWQIIQAFWIAQGRTITMPPDFNGCNTVQGNQFIFAYATNLDNPSNPKSFTVAPYCEDNPPNVPPSFDTQQGFHCVRSTTPRTMNVGFCADCVANPVFPGFGNKLQVEIDYVGAGLFPLKFERYFNSVPSASGVFPTRVGGSSKMGYQWWHNYDRRLFPAQYASPIGLVGMARQDGRVYGFALSGGLYVGDPGVIERLEKLTVGWKVINAEDEVELYDDAGKLLSITNRAGLGHTLSYFTSGILAGYLEKVTDSFGRILTFEYDTSQRVKTVVDPAGGRIEYTYQITSGRNVIQTVKYQDLKIRTYHYENSLVNLLTGITDENGVRFSTYTYDPSARATLTKHADDAGKVVITYPSSGTTNVETWVSSSPLLTATRTHSYQAIHGVMRNTAIAGDVCPSCGPKATTYDVNGFPSSKTDWNDNRTNFVHDPRGLETSRTEALTSGGGTTPETRTIATDWHPTFRLPTKIMEAGRTTEFSYDPTGNLSKRKIIDSTSGESREWNYTYNANGSVIKMVDPRKHETDYTYYANNATCPGASAVGCRGQVETITNALKHVTTITEYNAHGQPLSITDPNGLVTTLAYDARLRLTSRSVGGETTGYAYDNVGQLKKVTLPDASFLEYTYDNAHRLTQIADNLGNKIGYTLDLADNRTLEEVRDPASQLAQTRSRVYSNLNRLAQEIGAQGQSTAYGYDNQGNLTSIDGPLAGTGDTTVNTYDALNRLIRVTDPLSGQVNYGYNALDQLASVSDPKTLTTSYSYNALNNLNQQVSPDTGTTVNTYDAAGNLVTQLDAKGQTTGYTYDALNRVLTIIYQGGVVHAYTYDQGTNGKGRLTQIVEPNGPTAYVYDQKGRLTSETRTINAVAYVTGYRYDASGRMDRITYPSGREVNYTFDALGRISQIVTTKDGANRMLLSGATYRPFGPVQGFTFGNGQNYSRGFDMDGRVASYTLDTQSFAMGYDVASRIQSLAESGNPTNTNTYGYDVLDRLTQAALPAATTFAYTYDGVGNRLTRALGASTDNFAYAAASNRLASVTPSGGAARTYVHDPNGSITADGINTYGYDMRGRMVQAVSGTGTTNYQVNSLGQRIRKTNAQGDTVYHYDAQGRLIAESNSAGAVQCEYVYLYDQPISLLVKP